MRANVVSNTVWRVAGSLFIGAVFRAWGLQIGHRLGFRSRLGMGVRLVHLRFETAPHLISGIELSTNGRKVAWSIAEYLESLEKGVDDLLQEKGCQRRTSR